MDQPKISIIVPVYNSAAYLEKCLNSLINQTLKEIEIILILDCPTDGSDKVAESFATKDQRIKLIHNSANLHTGLSRNKGIEAAQGEYIGFHDHDDFSETTMYKRLYDEVKKHDLDVARCNFKCIYPNGATNIEELYKYPEITENPTSKKEIFEKICNNTVSCVIWNHIYRKSFLNKLNLKFVDTSIVSSEDSIFFFQVYQHITKVGIVDDYLYSHVFHDQNAGKTYKHRSIRNRISFFEILDNFLVNNNLSENECLSYLSSNILKSLYSGSRQAILEFPLKKALKEIKQIKDNQLVKRSLKHMYKKRNRSELLKLKPTVIIFFFILKTIK